MCYRLIERYSVCRCLYHKHSVDTCAAANQDGHTVQERTILVGYLCSIHGSSSFRSDEGSRKVKNRKRPQFPSPASIATGQWMSSLVPVETDSQSNLSAIFEGGGLPTVTAALQSQNTDHNNHNSTKLLATTQELNDGPEVLSDAASVTSLEESLFSCRTPSSVSSALDVPGADDKLYTLLMTDELQDLYAKITKTMPVDVFELRLRRLLKQLSLDLKVESSNEQEKRAANFVRYKARNFARIISSTVEKGNNVKSMLLLGQDVLDEENFEDAEFDDIDEDPLDIQCLETFVATSSAFANFKTKLEQLKPLNSESILNIPEYLIDAASLEDPLPPHYRRTGVLWEKVVDIAWTCQCGMAFTETVTEYQPGAAKDLTNEISQNSPVDVERLAGTQDLAASSSCSKKSPGRSFHRSGFSNPEETIKVETPSDRQKSNDIKLQNVEITTTPCDHSSYHTLHNKYFGRLHKYFHWLTLTEISSVDFVKFHLYWSTNVSIDPSDIGVLPPNPSTDYAYTSNTNPPVPRTAVQHFLQNPSHAPRRPRHRPRIPKKQHSPLELRADSEEERQGYGLYVREQICWVRVLILEAFFAMVCAVVAVVWCVTNGGGVQDGCAIAGTGLAYASIGLGMLQVALQAGRMWS